MTVRTPQTYYSDGWVVTFTTKRKKTFYDILKWNKLGTNQSLIKSGRLIDEKPQSLITDLINGDAKMGDSV